LWIDGKRATRARRPDKGFFDITDAPDAGTNWEEGQHRFRFKGDDVSRGPYGYGAEAIIMMRWVESRLPSHHFAHQFLRFPKNKVMPEAELRQLLHDHGFTISHMSYRQNDKGAVFEYRMVIGTVDQQNLARLATTLHKTKDILEFRISPTGD